jgi:hydrogenase 3 maturation protease
MYLGKVVKESPDTILIVDAVQIGGEAGSIGILDPEELTTPFFTTHDLPLRLLLEQLRTITNARIYVLGVQPEQLSVGEGLSGSARRALRSLERLLLKTMSKA